MNERIIFDAALEIDDPLARRAFVEKSCEGNQPMRAAVEELLKSHDAAGSFLKLPIGDQIRDEQTRGEPMKSDSTKEGDSLGSSESNVPSKPNDPSDKTHVYESGIHKDDNADDEFSPDLSFLQPSSKPGSLGLLGHYEVLKVLGQGGFGIVLKAFDEKLHRHVAIKVMNAQMAATSPPRKRFLREARAAAAIRHENIVQVYSVEEQPLPYLVMEFIDGPTLQQKQAGHGPLEVPEWLQIGRQIAAGLAAAHATGLIHRDIKPGNVLIEQGAEQKVKITDFGLARAADDASLSRSGTISGTPMYMAPEQALGHALDHRADLFSLGSVLYELATGRPPFRAANTVAVLRRVVDDTPRPMQEIIPELPDWLVAIVNKLLAKNPDDRFQTAKELALLLGRCQSELQLTGQVTCVNEGHDGNTQTSLYQPVVKSTEPATGVTAQHTAPAAWEGSQNLVSFVGTCLLFTLITAGAVWWGQALTGWSRPLLHGLIAVGAGLTIVLAWIAESISSRQQRPGRAQYWGGIIAAACLFTVGNVVTLKWGPQSMTPVAERQVLAPTTDSGLKFDGKDDFVKVGPFDLSSPQYTLEAFVTSASDGDNGVIALLKSDGKAPELMYLYDGYPAKVRTSGAGIIGQRPYQTVNAPLMSGTREHRALVMDGQVMHYFVNGIWQGKRYCTARQGRMWEMRELIIGCKANETEFFRGQIDQLRLSKIARYSDNFTVNSALTSDDSTLALYNFDEGEGDVLKDASGNGHHGKIIGATWVKSNSPVAPPAPRRYDSGEWIDVLSLIDPQADKLAVSGMTGKNDWRKENEELVVAKDEQASKLLMPLDSAWSAFECEIEFTRRAGRGGLNLNIPSQRGECPVVVDHPSGKGGVSLGARNNGVLLTEGVQIETGKRATMRIEVRREQDVDRISVALNGTTVGQWSGDRNQLSKESNEGFPVGRRMSLWIPEGGHEFTVHRIRVRMLDGETATTLRPVPRTLPTDGNAPLAATGWPADAPPPAIAPFNAEQAKQHQAAWAKYLGVPVEYTNSLGMKFRLIPPGEFLMGSSPEEIEAALKEMENSNDKEWRKHWEECVKSEGPQHSVILTQPTYLGIHEVTQADFEKAVGSNPALFKKNALHMEKVEGLDTSKHPLEGVSWNDAAEFCVKLSQQEKLKPWYFRAGESVTRLTGTGYQLPTEAQWEFACRAGATTKFWFGDQSTDLAKASWFDSNSGNRPHPVGELKENSFGLFDVHGNVSEWMQDGWELNYYDQFANKPAIDPDGAPQVGTRRVIRGGAWDSRAYQCRAAFRNSPDTPSAYSIGFRISLPIDAVRQALKLAGPAILTRASTRPATPATTDPIDFAAERQAAEWVLENKGSMEIAASPDWQWRGYGTPGGAKPLPSEPFVITSLTMKNSQVKTESDLERLTRCRYLEILGISGGTIDRQAIDLLTRLPRLKTLTLSDQKNLRTSALPKLGRISTLDHLSITSDMVDDRLEFVRHLLELRTLNIYGPQPPDITLLAEAPQLHTILLTTPDAVEDAKLAEVQARNGQLRIVVGWMGKYRTVGRDPVHEAAKHLVELGVECLGGVNYWQLRTKLLTKADFEDGSVWSFNVSKVPASVQLSADDREKLKLLDSYHFTAEGQRDADELAKSLSGNHGIANFTMTDCDLTDAGLEHLQKLVSLRFINVTKSKVTRAGVERFHRAVPLCGITSDFGLTLPHFMSADAARPK